MPASYEDFAVYMETMLASDLLTVGDTARELAKALFAPTLLGRLTFAAGFVGIGLLPERLRRAYGFSWDDQRERRLHRLAELSGRIRSLLPSVLCVSPRALIAERHIPHQHVCLSGQASSTPRNQDLFALVSLCCGRDRGHSQK